MERDQASKFVNDLLRLMISRNGSDLFLTADFPPAIKIDGKLTKVSPQPLTGQHTLQLARSVMNDKQAAEFERTKECNFAISPQGVGRFRVNAFMQQSHVGLVFRTIPQMGDVNFNAQYTPGSSNSARVRSSSSSRQTAAAAAPCPPPRR